MSSLFGIDSSPARDHRGPGAPASGREPRDAGWVPWRPLGRGPRLRPDGAPGRRRPPLRSRGGLDSSSHRACQRSGLRHAGGHLLRHRAGPQLAPPWPAPSRWRSPARLGRWRIRPRPRRGRWPRARCWPPGFRRSTRRLAGQRADSIGA